jgi:uncharacterized protein (DUF1501 family)
MSPNRREFLRSTLVACGGGVPLFLARSAAALPAESPDGHVLVVVQLDGGNDGLNTVIPYRDDEYRKRRPRLRQDRGTHRIDDRMALHPALVGLAHALENGQLAVVQGVGYPNPNRSHFESMAIWHTARLTSERATPGWLAGATDRRPIRADAPALHIGDTLLPQALYGARRPVPSLANLEQFRRRVGVPVAAGARAQRVALDEVIAEERGEPGSLLQFVQQNTAISYTSSDRLESVARQSPRAARYPESYGLAQRLKLIAQLIKAGLSTSLYYTQLAGFDTHANQLGTHDGLLRELGDSLQAFLDDLNRSGEAGRVLVLVFSEFGRRLAENASGGTDHGTAAPVFLLGAGVRPGLHGPCPDLRDLDAAGDPKHATDFRQVYATLLDRWLGCPSAAVLGGDFEDLPVLRMA